MKNLKLYLAVAYGLVWATALVFSLAGGSLQTPARMVVASACMFFPLVAVLVCQASSRQRLLSGIGISWKVNRWWFAGWLIIPAIVLLTILFDHWMVGTSLHTEALRALTRQTHLPPLAAIAATALSGMLAGATINALLAFGEESGWRGYLLAQFRGRSFLTAAVVTGLVWGLWHAPLILMGHNYPQHPNLWGVLAMMVLCIPLSFILQYFRLRSGSVIVPAIMHGTFNALAGLTLMVADHPVELLSGSTGLSGLLALLTICLVLFLADRYITRRRLITSPIPA